VCERPRLTRFVLFPLTLLSCVQLTASSSNEVAYAVLSHVALIVERAQGVFDDEYKQFFCKFTEPSCVKSLKMGILPKIANAVNAREIVAELTEYVAGVDADLARQAVRSIGEIAVRVPSAAEAVAESLLELIEMEAEYVRAETVVVMQDVLRKYPDRAPSVIPSLHRCLKRMEDPYGKAAVIWMIGEYGQLIDDAPYVLEPLIDGVSHTQKMMFRAADARGGGCAEMRTQRAPCGHARSVTGLALFLGLFLSRP
jgi:vesicle coat complex subunit